jgi:hypothetical protein
MEKSETVKPYTTFQVCGASSIGVSAFWYRAEDYDALSAQVRELREETEQNVRTIQALTEIPRHRTGGCAIERRRATFSEQRNCRTWKWSKTGNCAP